MKKIYLFFLTLFICLQSYSQNQNFLIDNSFPYHVNEETLGKATIGGDTIFISSTRTNPLRFQFTNGDIYNPLVIINKGGQVNIESPDSYSWGAITFENCKYIKISGAGNPNYKYGFQLSANVCGLAFSDLNSIPGDLVSPKYIPSDTFSIKQSWIIKFSKTGWGEGGLPW